MAINKLFIPGEMQASLAAQFKRSRLEFGHSRAKAAKLTGVPEPTLRGFETKSQISLRQFLMLCHVYGDLAACEQLFPKKSLSTMEQLLTPEPKRQRGRS